MTLTELQNLKTRLDRAEARPHRTERRVRRAWAYATLVTLSLAATPGARAATKTVSGHQDNVSGG